jgi:hypothetical protein
MTRTVEQNVDTIRKIAVFWFVCSVIGIFGILIHAIARVDWLYLFDSTPH